MADWAELEGRAQELHAAQDVSDAALNVHERILALRPTDAAAANRRALLFVRRGLPEDALAAYRDAIVANRDNAIAAGKVRELEATVAKRQSADFVRRPPAEIVEPVLRGPGRVPALRFFARSIRQIQSLDGTRLAVTDLPSDRRFRVVGGIYSGVTPWNGLLCVSIDKARGRSVVEAVQAVGGIVTDRPGPMSAVPRSLQLGVPLNAVDRFAEALWEPHVEHLRASIEYGAPTWLHRHDPALMTYLLTQADA
ncbi:hypothetical protein [Solirubrobacter soli]|uniref:hypothetical protein n=1 Tax=Solirubrobacter soli TaxID=363832 RepID=UPI00040E941C|nr:hypothetical protein [Solirubrobacter soli]